jgi:hypothetical protein
MPSTGDEHSSATTAARWPGDDPQREHSRAMTAALRPEGCAVHNPELRLRLLAWPTGHDDPRRDDDARIDRAAWPRSFNLVIVRARPNFIGDRFTPVIVRTPYRG